MNNYKHNATFYGHVSRKYYFNYVVNDRDPVTLIPTITKSTIEEKFDKVESEVFHQEVLDCLPFHVGDNVHIDILKLDVYIEKVVKNTNGDVDYYTSHITRKVEDDISQKSLDEAMGKKAIYDRKNVELFNYFFDECKDSKVSNDNIKPQHITTIVKHNEKLSFGSRIARIIKKYITSEEDIEHEEEK